MTGDDRRAPRTDGPRSEGGPATYHFHQAPTEPTEAALAAVEAQLGRPSRGIMAVAHRCPCGLPDGTPFPTLYYLTCPKATSAVGRLEAAGVMREMTDRLREDPDLAARYRAAHEDYLRRRAEIAAVPEIEGVSAGGMPDRVKCLHVHLAHALAVGPGVNPFGDETCELVGEWWQDGQCVKPEEDR